MFENVLLWWEGAKTSLQVNANEEEMGVVKVKAKEGTLTLL